MWLIVLGVAFLFGVQNNSWNYFAVALVGFLCWKAVTKLSGMVDNSKALKKANKRIERLKDEILEKEGEIAELRDYLADEAVLEKHVENAFKKGVEEAVRLYVVDRSQFDAIMNSFLKRQASQQQAEQLQRKQEQDRREQRARREREARERASAAKSSSEWWTVLGVDRFCTLAEAKKAYHKLALRYHTDNKETGDKAKMQEINLAFERAELSAK